MREWVPVPGSAKARLIEAALHHFERVGYEACNVTDLAAKAGVTTGSLYHHFGSKLGLYAVVRDDLDKRITDRMEGAAAGVSGGAGLPKGARNGDRSAVANSGAVAAATGAVEGSWPAVCAALLVGFDAAVRFDACRLLGEPPLSEHADSIEATTRSLLPPDLVVAAVLLVAAWRATLLSVADGIPAESARAALEYVLRP